ncbi:hypothetical protein ACFX13_038630 [Malus domestica]
MAAFPPVFSRLSCELSPRGLSFKAAWAAQFYLSPRPPSSCYPHVDSPFLPTVSAQQQVLLISFQAAQRAAPPFPFLSCPPHAVFSTAATRQLSPQALRCPVSLPR